MTLVRSPGWSHDVTTGGLLLRGEFETIQIRCSDAHARRLDEALEGRLPWLKLDLDEQQVMRGLREHGVLISAASSASERHSRTAEYVAAVSGSTRGFDDLRESSVLVLGVGGTGSIAVEHLVGAGVESLILVDQDVVEASNLNRQYMFSEGDVGVAKVDAAARWIRVRAPRARLQLHHREITSTVIKTYLKSLIDEADAVFVAIDSPWPTRPLEILDACIESATACVFSSVGLQKGFVSPVLGVPGRSARRADVLQHVGRPSRTRGDPLIASHGVTNGLVATVAADRLISHLCGFLDEAAYRTPLVADLRRAGTPAFLEVSEVRL